MMQRDQARTQPLSPRRLVWLTVLAASFGIAIHVAAKPIQGPLSNSLSDELPGLAVAPAPIVQDVVVLPVQASGDSPAKSASFVRPYDSQAQTPDEEAVRIPTNDQSQEEPDLRVRRYELSDWMEDESFQPVAYFFDDPPTRVSHLGNHDRLTDSETSAEIVWPRAESLLLTTDKLANWTAVSVWRYELEAILENLSLLETIHDSQVPVILTQLRKLADQLDAHIIANSATPAASPDAAQGVLSDELRRLQHQVRIRADIWSAAHDLGCCQFDSIGDFQQTSARSSHLGADHRWLPHLDLTWREYIELDELQTAWQAGETDAAQLRTAARRTLARLSSPNLNAEQNDYLRQAISPEVVEWLIRQARGPCDLPDLLRHLESYLETSHGYHAAAIAEAYQNLVWHDHPRYQALAQQIETHLRNPNVRISASDVLLNLLLPDLPDVEEPVRENILGANVLGRSRVANRLQVRLFPDPDKINLRLDAIGLVRSSTQATRGGFVVDNLGTTRFQASKPLVIGRHGLAVGAPQDMADSHNQGVGFRCHFDGIPF
ncbi:MAG TPA: hypothetical protein PKD54_01590, partial [Pirellulaceae bacterium]|nr:hypothetical protein [Pirellulaceae bacterium]